uniref:Uncharacterized protein n=1 Tax=Rhizophora mucronata TaxID=61149 RepID=A0A2P2R314_RHIMU
MPPGAGNDSSRTIRGNRHQTVTLSYIPMGYRCKTCFTL